MNDPDWGRMMISPPPPAAGFSALGDPTRWGASVSQVISIGGGSLFGALVQSDQIIQVQCRDHYPRAWTIAGVLTAPREAFLFADGYGDVKWASVLNVTMGLGQAAIVHNFNIRATVASDAPWYWNSDGNGTADMFDTTTGGPNPRSVPFVIPGAIVGTTVAIRVINAAFNSGQVIPFDATFTVALSITPFSAGSGS